MRPNFLDNGVSVKKYSVLVPLLFVASILLFIPAASAAQPALQATPAGTPNGPRIIVPEQVNVRLGPSLDYEKIGVLISGQEAPALGRSPGGDWI